MSEQEIRELEQQVEKDQLNYPLKIRLGDLYLKQGRKQEAAMLFAQATRLDTNAVYPRIKIGEILSPGEIVNLNLPVPKGIYVAKVLASFLYPFKGFGPGNILIGTVCFGILDIIGLLLGWLGPLGIAFWSLVWCGVLGYISMYQFAVVGAAAIGDPGPPEWPEYHDIFTNFIIPIFKLMGCCVVSFGPVALFHLLMRLGYIGDYGTSIRLGLAITGAIYFPLTFLFTFLYTWSAILNPFLILFTIVRLHINYLWCLIGFYIWLAICIGLVSLTRAIPIRYIGSPLKYPIIFFCIMAAMYVVGRLYYHKEMQLRGQ